MALALAGCGGSSLDDHQSGGAAAGGSPGTAGAAGGSAGAAAPPEPILHWTLDDEDPSDGSTVNSGTISGWGLEFSGVVSIVPGEIGQAVSFDLGAFGIASGGARGVLDVYPQYTISFWVNSTSSITTGVGVVDFLNSDSAPYGGIRFGFAQPGTFKLCVATTTNPSLTGRCPTFAAPPAGTWHNVILRYAGTGTGAGQGAGVDVYEDGLLAATVPNDADNNPVFNPGIIDGLYVGTGGISLDDLRIYNHVFPAAEQCTVIIGGAWTGTTCTLP